MRTKISKTFSTQEMHNIIKEVYIILYLSSFCGGARIEPDFSSVSTKVFLYF